MNRALPVLPYYRPIQPSANNHDGVVYEEHLADNRVRNFIYCYWQLKTATPLPQDFTYRIVADGCTDVFFELASPADSYVMGFSNTYNEFSLGRSFCYVGIRFLPAMFAQLFKIDASAISNRVEVLDNVTSSAASFIRNNISGRQDMQGIAQMLNNHFVQLIARCDWKADDRFFDAVSMIYSNPAIDHIQKTISTGISSRQLRRLFEIYVGTSIKTFSKVVRFQYVLGASPSLNSLRSNKPYFDAGYYDQSHFIKDFTQFSGLTPTNALRT